MGDIVSAKTNTRFSDVIPSKMKDNVDERGAQDGGGGIYGPSAPSRRTRDNKNDSFQFKQPDRINVKPSDAQLWQKKKLIDAGILSASDFPGYNEETGVMGDFDEPEDDFDVELNELEPVFLRGQMRLSRELSPVAMVLNQEGSMARAAKKQIEFVKEKKEIKRAEAEASVAQLPRDMDR